MGAAAAASVAATGRDDGGRRECREGLGGGAVSPRVASRRRRGGLVGS
jgi:hypothetical protein